MRILGKDYLCERTVTVNVCRIRSFTTIEQQGKASMMMQSYKFIKS
jgi:hypothetical protein